LHINLTIYKSKKLTENLIKKDNRKLNFVG